MQYFFELGNFKGLSQAELGSVFDIFGITKDSIKNFSEKILLVDNKVLDDILVKEIFDRLGGYIRAGVVIDDIEGFLNIEFTKKVVFGVSYIGLNNFDTDKFNSLGNQLKKHFKQRGLGSRFVLPQKTELNAAQVIRNSILEKGFELCILENSKTQIYGKTLSIQDIDSFSYRDYNKPSSDTEMGMLPPKLARIMCNLSGLKSGVIWDPFCGSGTIPMEAAILGYNVLASDMDPEAVDATKRNILWLSEKGYISDTKYETFELDITKPRGDVLKKLKHTEIDAIIFEPYMGPPQTQVLTETKAQLLLEEVKKLYLSFLKLLEKNGKRHFRMISVIPSYRTNVGWKTLNTNEIFDKRWSILNKEYAQEDLKWERNNSIISRNIFIFERS